MLLRLISLTALAFFLALPHVQAQTPPQQMAPGTEEDTTKYNQYPSFFEVQTETNGVVTLVRCGYTQTPGDLLLDPTYYEMVTVNRMMASYLRLQHIDNYLVMTAPGSGNTGRYLLQIVSPNGVSAAKECFNDASTDTLQGCIAAQPFMPAQQLTQQDADLGDRCVTFFGKAVSQLDRTTFNAQKTAAYKEGLRQKVRVLLAP